MRQFSSGATRDTDEGKIDYEGFLSPLALRSYGEYMLENQLQADGQIRASDNWQKGIPIDAYMKSMFRHFMAVWEGHRAGTDNIRDLNALFFNVHGMLHEKLKLQSVDNGTDTKNVPVKETVQQKARTNRKK